MDVPNGAGGSTPQPPSPPHKALRALVVDGDTAHLQDLETLLRHSCYQVTACPHPVTALNLLRGSNGEFDVVLIDTSTQNLAWSEFLERVHCQMCIPIVLMSVAGLKDTIPAVVEEKASRHLTKPVSMEQLKCLRQLIVAGKPPPFNGESSSSCSSTGGGRITEKKEQGKKSEAEEKGEHGNDDHSGYPAIRKPRVVWTTELHNQFVDAVNKLGKGAVPKKILEEMDVSGLTRENIASHLQKYRLSLKRSESHQQRKNPQELSTAILRNLPPEVPLDPPNWALQHTCGVPGSSHLCRNNAAYDHNLGRLSAQRRFNIPLVQSYEQQILLRQQDQRMQSSAAAAATAYLSSNINLPATSHMPIRNPNLKENMLMGGRTSVQYGAMQNLRSSWHVQASDFAKVSQELLGPEIYMKDELRESYTVHQIFPSIRTQDLHGSSVSSSDLPGSSVSSFNLPRSSVTEDTYEEYIRNLPDLISDLESSGP